jgi:flagellar biosynthesis protein FlhA
VKGDAIAALVIVALNLAGGIAAGMARGLAPAEAFNTFAILSIGNALVTTLPAFLISLAMGLMVTRVAVDRSLGADLAQQLAARPDALRGAAALIGALALVPALPGPLFATLAAAALAASQLARRRQFDESEAAKRKAAQARRSAMRKPESALGLVGVDALSIDLGGNLLVLIAPPNDEALLDRIGEVRRALAVEIGIAIPGVRLRDDLTRDAQTYAIRVRDAVAAAGKIYPGRLVAVGDPKTLASIDGEPIREPVYGLDGRTIPPEARAAAERAGLLAFDAISILCSHLAEVARLHAAELFGRQEFATLLEHLRAAAPALVKEIGEGGISMAIAHRAFVLLLRERMWPRDPLVALEALIDAADAREPRELAEAMRRRLVPTELRRRNETPCALIAAPELEEVLAQCDDPQGGVAPDPTVAVRVREQLMAHAQRFPRNAAVITSARTRPLLGELVARWGAGVEVFAYPELPREMPLEPLGVIGADTRGIAP